MDQAPTTQRLLDQQYDFEQEVNYADLPLIIK